MRKPSARLGFNHASEIKYHPWFRNIPWKKLAAFEVEAPYIPAKDGENFDSKSIA